MSNRLFLLFFVILLFINSCGCAPGLICLGAGAAAATVAVVEDNRNASEYENGKNR
jgi:hypothetical protein